MSLFKRFIKTKEKDEERYKNAPAFRQMMKDLEMEETEFIARFEKILPEINIFNPSSGDVMSSENKDKSGSKGYEPLSYPVNFDEDLCIRLRADYGTHSELMLERHIEVAKEKLTPDQLVGKSFSNLFKQIEDNISISMITDDIGMLSGCNSHESSLVVINEIWKLISDRLTSDEVVFGIPAQDIFVFAAAGRSEAVEQLDMKVKDYYNDPDRINKLTPRLYVMRKEGNTEVFRA